MTEEVTLCLIVARSRNGIIGSQGDLPWRLSEDLKFFKRTTLGKPIIMGRKTWESLPRKPLPGRDNIVVSKDWTYEVDGARLYSNVSVAIAAARSIAARQGQNEIFIIGGSSLYESALPKAERLYLTEVETVIEGDARFPDFDEAEWIETAREDLPADERNDYAVIRRTLDRK